MKHISLKGFCLVHEMLHALERIKINPSKRQEEKNQELILNFNKRKINFKFMYSEEKYYANSTCHITQRL